MSPLSRRSRQSLRQGQPSRRGQSSRHRQVFRQQRSPARWKQVAAGLLLGSAGAGLVVALMQLPRRFDTLLLLSNALAHVIRGIQLLVMGLLQVVAMVLLVALAVGALVLLVAGLVRVVRAFLPQPRSQPSRPALPLKRP